MKREVTGMPEQEEIYLTGPEVCRRFGITDMTLWRWLQDEKLGFPRPIKPNRRRFFRKDAIEAWERAQADKAA